MALLHYEFKSDVLKSSTAFYAIVPELKRLKNESCKVLYLLHGMGDDHTKWIRRTNLEQYCKATSVIVIMPQVGKSFYTNMVYGENYWDFLSEELPEVVAQLLPISNRREDTFVAGLSMGGFGAFKWALNKPKMFSAAASFSGVLDLPDFFTENSQQKKLCEQLDLIGDLGILKHAIFGNHPITNTSNDLVFQLNQAISEKTCLPDLFQFCGEDDPILPYNQKFFEAAKCYPNLTYQYQTKPGNHDWDYWDYCINSTLSLFKIK